MQIKVAKSEVPKIELRWNRTRDGYEGVNTFEGKLIWLYVTKKPEHHIKKKRQSFIHFINNGPKNSEIPAGALLRLYEVILNALVEP